MGHHTDCWQATKRFECYTTGPGRSSFQEPDWPSFIKMRQLFQELLCFYQVVLFSLGCYNLFYVPHTWVLSRARFYIQFHDGNFSSNPSHQSLNSLTQIIHPLASQIAKGFQYANAVRILAEVFSAGHVLVSFIETIHVMFYPFTVSTEH